MYLNWHSSKCFIDFAWSAVQGLSKSSYLIHPSTFGPPWPHSSLQRWKQLRSRWVSSTYLTLNSEMSIDFEWLSNTRSSSIQKCLFIGMSHTGHQNFRVCNPACGCDRVWFPPACVCQRPAVTESVPELSVGCVQGGRVLVWRVGSVDGMNGTSGWLWVYVCVGVIPSGMIVFLCLGPVEPEYVCDCECV